MAQAGDSHLYTDPPTLFSFFSLLLLLSTLFSLPLSLLQATPPTPPHLPKPLNQTRAIHSLPLIFFSIGTMAIPHWLYFSVSMTTAPEYCPPHTHTHTRRTREKTFVGLCHQLWPWFCVIGARGNTERPRRDCGCCGFCEESDSEKSWTKRMKVSGEKGRELFHAIGFGPRF